MVKTLVTAAAVLAIVGSSAMACGSHKSGGKGSTSTTMLTTKVIVVT